MHYKAVCQNFHHCFERVDSCEDSIKDTEDLIFGSFVIRITVIIDG